MSFWASREYLDYKRFLCSSSYSDKLLSQIVILWLSTGVFLWSTCHFSYCSSVEYCVGFCTSLAEQHWESIHPEQHGQQSGRMEKYWRPSRCLRKGENALRDHWSHTSRVCRDKYFYGVPININSFSHPWSVFWHLSSGPNSSTWGKNTAQ